jgi:DNA helicase-2/ATP-dependent DNA helicase PcrA
MSLTLIGDPKQTLYLFRNANPDILEHMDRLLSCPEHQEGYILKNYRSPKQLVMLANYFSSVFHGRLQVHHSDPHKDVEEDVLSVKTFDSVISESRFVSREISKLRNQGVDLKNIAILARTNRQLLDFEGGLISEKIPYIIRYDSRSVLNQSAFKVLYSIYSLLFNPKDINALCEICIPIKGIGAKFIDNLREKALYLMRKNPNFSIFTDIHPQNMGKMTKQFQMLYDLLEKIVKPMQNEFLKKTTNFFSFNSFLKDILYRWVECDGERNGDAVIKFTISRDMFNRAFTVFHNIYKIASEDFEFKNSTDLDKFIKIYETLQLSQEAYTEYKNQNGEKKSAVMLSTIHSYKGKEADHIFGTCLRRYNEVNTELFSEKCVFYVLVTRAKRKLYLTSSELIRSFKGDLIRAGSNDFIEKYLEGLSKLKQELKGENNV